MTTEDAFLLALRESPDNGDLRLVFADWLDDQGDPRAEFFRLWLRLPEQPGDDPRAVGLELRAKELKQRDEAAWLGPVAEAIVSWEVRRGLLEIRGRAEYVAGRLGDPLLRGVLRWVRLL